MEIKVELKKVLETILEKLELPTVEVKFEYPANEEFGDISTNLALLAFGHLKGESANFNSPRQLAEKIISEVNSEINLSKNPVISSAIEKIEVAGAGFINITLSEHYLLTRLPDINRSIRQTDSENSDVGNKTVVEYTDPNPFKEMHIGHLYSNIVGESLARLFEYEGRRVRRVCYQGDVGMHVAKSVWGMEQKLDASKLNLEELNAKLVTLAELPLSERMQFLGEAYALGASVYKEDEVAAEEIRQYNYLVFAAGQQRLVNEENWQPQIDYSKYVQGYEAAFERVSRLYETGRKWSLEYFDELYRRLDTNPHRGDSQVFDAYYFESEVGEYGYRLVQEFLDKGVFERGEKGAVIFPGEKYGLHSRVFINALGLPTYEAKELGLAPKKYQDWPYDQSVIVTGNEINEYFKVLLKAMRLVKPELAEKTIHISHGMIKLPEGKMSSRTGKILRAEWLLDEARVKALEMLEASEKVFEAEKEMLAEKIGAAAIKYALLKANIGRDVVFDFNKEISFEGNCGPYLLYTYARSRSVLRNAQAQGIIEHLETEAIVERLKELEAVALNTDERRLISWLLKRSELLSDAASTRSPQVVAQYVYELAQRFNRFYNAHAIIQADSNPQIQLRVLLTALTAETLKHNLYLLGIETVEQM